MIFQLNCTQYKTDFTKFLESAIIHVLSLKQIPAGIMYSLKTFPLHVIFSDKTEHCRAVSPGRTGHELLHPRLYAILLKTQTTLRSSRHCGPPWLRVGTFNTQQLDLSSLLVFTGQGGIIRLIFFRSFCGWSLGAETSCQLLH